MFAGHHRRVKFSLRVGLDLHYDFHEGTGTTVGDVSTNSNDGTTSGGATWVTGRVGASAISLDGVDDMVAIPATGTEMTKGNLGKTSTENYSLSIWYKGTEAGTDPTNGSALIGWDSVNFWGHLTNAGGKAEFLHYDGAWQHNLKSTTSINDDNWHLVTLANDNGETAKLYVDGVEEASGSSELTTGAVARYFQPYGVGVGYLNTYTIGSFDDVRLYSKTLTSPEAYELSIRE